jgi:hypothetical protein
MHPPKILSWLARRANLSLYRAEAIWHASVLDWQRDRAHPECDSACWQRLMDAVRLRIVMAATVERTGPVS